MASSVRLPVEVYTVGWIAALDKELAAAKAVLDEIHQKPEGFRKHAKDSNNYVWGNIGGHNIAIVSLPAGRYGNVSAASTAWSMMSSFPHLRFGLLVGIEAGVPRLAEGVDIRLGDVVVSQPTGASSGVIQYDLGKLRVGGRFDRVGSLNSPPDVLLKGLATLKANHLMEDSQMSQILEDMMTRYPKLAHVNAQGGRYGNALQAASCGFVPLQDDGTRIAQTLLDAGAEVNAQGGEFGNALRAAAYHCNPGCVRLLLDSGASMEHPMTRQDVTPAIRCGGDSTLLWCSRQKLRSKLETTFPGMMFP